MDSRSPSPVSQIEFVEVASLSLGKNQLTGLTGRQEHFQPHSHPNVIHVTETRQEKISLRKDLLPGENPELSQDVLGHRSTSLPKPVRDFEPAKMLARPPSTGKDLNSGFCYQKPIMPALNFSRSPENKPSAPSKPDVDLQKHEFQDSAWDRLGQVHTSDSVHIKSMDFDNLAGGTRSSNDPQVPSLMPTIDPIKTISPARDILRPFPGGNVSPPVAYHDSLTASADNTKIISDPTKSHGMDIPDQTWEPSQAARSETAMVDTAVFDPAVRRNKVTKAKHRRPVARYANDGAIVQPDLGSSPSEEDLLNLLAYRYKKDCESKANREAILQAKNLEVGELKRNQDNLKRDLAESERNITLQEEEIGRYKEAISKKVAKLTKFVNGLAKDHNQLRNDAKQMAEKQTVARADGIELAADIQSVRALAQEWAKTSADNPGLTIRDARQRIDQLENAVANLDRELEAKSGVLATERDRIVELEAKIKLAAGDHDEVKALMDRHHKAIIEKLNILPSILELAHGNNIPAPVAELRIKVEECLGLLETVHGSSNALPKMLDDILGPVRVACGEILASVAQTREDYGLSNRAISTLEASLKEDISALKEAHDGTQGLTEELVILRESQAALTEKVRGKEEALAEAQERCVAVQNDKQSLLARVSALEFEAAAAQRESEGLRRALDTLQEAEPANAEFEAHLATVQKEVTDLRDKLQAQTGSVADLRKTKDWLESERAELQAAVATLEQDKLVSKQQSDMKCIEIRKELAASSRHARDMVVHEFGNKLYQMTESKKEVEEELETLHRGLNQYKAQISGLREDIVGKERSLEVSEEQLQLAAEKANTRDAEIQAIKEDRAANAKVLKQALNNADALEKRVASLTEMNSKSEGERAALRAKYEKAEELQERILGLYRAVGLGDGAASLSMQMVDLLEEMVLALKIQQSLSVTKVNPKTHIIFTQGAQLPEELSSNTKCSRRKVIRHTSTDKGSIRDAQTPLGPGSEGEFSAVESRFRETTVEVSSFAHKASSQGMRAHSEASIRPYEIDSTSAALIQETQNTDSFVPLWDLEGEVADVPTSPFTDLSAFFPTSPLLSPKQWASPVRQEEPIKQSTKSGARKVPSGKDTKVTSKGRVQTPLTPRHPTKAVRTSLERETIEKGQSSRDNLPTSQKVFSPAPAPFGPSTDHISRQKNAPTNSSSSGRTNKEKGKKDILHQDDESEARPAGPQFQTTTKLPLAYHGVSGDKNKSTSGRVATQGILKKPIPTISKKRVLEGAGVQADDAASVAKRPKREGRVGTSSQKPNAPSSSVPKPPLPISGRNTHQHPYSPTAKKTGTSLQKRKRSQTSEGDSERHHSSSNTLT